MGLVSHDPFYARALAYCDTCDTVLLPRHRHTPRSFRACGAADIEPLFWARDELVATAQDAGWVASADGRWSCSECRSAVAVATDRAAERSRRRGTTILIAEDHPDSREALRWCLDECGATCLEASSGSEALEAFNQRRPHILLADVWMPDVDGLELIRRIRDLPSEQGRLTPAIAVSAQANEEQALMAGYHAVIPKPYDPTLVVQMVEEFVGADIASPSRKPLWTVIPHAPGTVVMTFVGHLGVSDAKASTQALLGHLETEPRKLVVDLRRVTGVSAVAGSVAQRALWTVRHKIRHVHIIGGPASARVVASATCRLLGLGCTLDSGGAVP